MSVHRAKRYAPLNGGTTHQSAVYKCGQSPLTGRSNPNALQNQHKLRLRTPHTLPHHSTPTSRRRKGAVPTQDTTPLPYRFLQKNSYFFTLVERQSHNIKRSTLTADINIHSRTNLREFTVHQRHSNREAQSRGRNTGGNLTNLIALSIHQLRTARAGRFA